jgi:hypothetical protein
LVDATNAFNSLNRQVALWNVLHLCPSIAPAIVNTYRANPQLFVDGEVIYSREGTTQGDPLAMAMYAIATIPVIHKLNELSQVQSGLPIMPLQVDSFIDLRSGGTHWKRLGLTLGIMQMPQNHGSLSRRNMLLELQNYLCGGGGA